jgi:SAM-dependent methyltransferase
LDVGCSTGLWLDRLRKQFGVSGVGSDISSGSIRTALRSSSRDLRFLRSDACAIPLSACTFDLVASLDLLEHVPDQDGCVAEMVRVLKPGGRLLLWTLNRNQRYTWNWWLSRVGIDVYDRVAHDPNLLPDPDRVREVLEGCGMQVERLTCYNAFFTLAMDEVIMMLVGLFERMGFFRSRSRFAAWVGGAFLTAVDGLSRHIGRLLGWLDQPWVAKGYSNGFLVLAQKLPDFGAARRRPESLELPGTSGAGVPRGGALPESTR